MTLWQSGGLAFGFVVYAVAWLWGGRPERFGVAILLLSGLLASRANAWPVGGLYPGFAIADVASFLIFGWWCLRSERWWPMVAASGLGLTVLGLILRLVEPTLSHDAMVSAHIGLGYVFHLALLFGVWESWLAGERPAGLAAWAKAARLTAARRDRRAGPPDPTRRSAVSAMTPSDPPTKTFIP